LTNPAHRSAFLAQLFDHRVAAADLVGSIGPELLYPAEAACCDGFAAKRIADFAAGRLCARRALDDLGIADFPLVVKADRTPRWPPGVVGSISHTRNYCCAVATDRTDVLSVGIDAEVITEIEPELSRLIFTHDEADYLASLADGERRLASTVIFSAKEAFYKSQFHRTRRWLDFHDASLELTMTDRQSGRFVVHASYADLGLGDRVRTPLHGRFGLIGEVVVTAVAIDSPPAQSTSA